MEIVEQMYEGKSASKNISKADANQHGPPQDVTYNIILWYASKTVYLS